MNAKKAAEEMDESMYDCQACEHFQVCYKIHKYHVSQIDTGLCCPSFKRKQSEGEWRPYKTPLDARQTGWICSNCSSVVYDLSNGDTDFCPNCGSKMKGV